MRTKKHGLRRLLRRTPPPPSRGGPASAPAPATVRDFQRSRVYRSEESCLPSVSQRGFRRVEQMQEYVDQLLAAPACACRRPGLRVTVKDGRGSRRARTDGASWIAVPRPMRQEWVLLHEAAHCLTSDKHGPEFCACYLELVGWRLGAEAQCALRQAFTVNRVRVGPDARDQGTPR